VAGKVTLSTSTARGRGQGAALLFGRCARRGRAAHPFLGLAQTSYVTEADLVEDGGSSAVLPGAG
jgi:hypothetical protein